MSPESYVHHNRGKISNFLTLSLTNLRNRFQCVLTNLLPQTNGLPNGFIYQL